MAGTSLSRRVLEVISEANLRRWTQWIVLSIAAIYLVQGCWLMARGAA